MQHAVILRILGILLSLFSLTMIPPLIISFVTNDGSSVLKLSLSKKNFIYTYPEAVERLVENSAINNLDDIIN